MTGQFCRDCGTTLIRGVCRKCQGSNAMTIEELEREGQLPAFVEREKVLEILERANDKEMFYYEAIKKEIEKI